MLSLVKKFPGEKGSVKRCVVVMQQPVGLSPKYGAKTDFLCTIPLMSKKIMSMLLTFHFTCIACFGLP
jgi:hypothetical protein